MENFADDKVRQQAFAPRRSATTTENFVYDGQNIVLILDGDGNVVERELTGAAPDQVFASENGSTNAVNWYLTDNQGTVRDVVRLVSGTPTEENHLAYAAFGNLIGQTSSAPGDQPTFHYNGAWQDPQTGLNKMGARWADLVDAVFASKDPIGYSSGTTNLSGYVGNSPTNFTDPSGMDWLSDADALDASGRGTDSALADPNQPFDAVGVLDSGAYSGSDGIPVNCSVGGATGGGPATNRDPPPIAAPDRSPVQPPPPFAPPMRTITGTTSQAFGKNQLSFNVTISGVGLPSGAWNVSFAGPIAIAHPVGQASPIIFLQNNTPVTIGSIIVTLK